MVKRASASKRKIVLVVALACSVTGYLMAWHPERFGWPGVYILSAWSPGPIRARALSDLEERASRNDLVVIKRMLRSEDPRIRRHGIALADRFRSMDEFFELERLTRDPDARVRASAHAYLPTPDDESLSVSAHMAGLRDDSDEVVAVAARRLEILKARQALPELIAYLRAKRQTGTFTGADIAVGNVAAEMTGLKVRFRAAPDLICGTALAREMEESDRPFPRTVRSARWFLRSLGGDWDDSSNIKPVAFGPVESSVIADNFAALEKLLAWWDAHSKGAQRAG